MKKGKISIYVVQVIIAVLAYMFGYSHLGSAFILLMAPLCVYMVIKQDAGYIPALAIHCMSQTSISFCILISIMLVCIFNLKKISTEKKNKIIYLLLLISLPLYVLLIYQRIFIDGDTWQTAFEYSVYYLAFWCFPYGFIISKTYNETTSRMIVVSLLVCYILCNLFHLAMGSRGFTIIVYFGMLYGFSEMLGPQKIKGLFIFLLSSLFFFRENMTFTELLTALYGCVLVVLVAKKRYKAVKHLTGVLPYVIIFILMIFAVSTYDTVTNGVHSDTMDFSSWEGFWARAKYKLYDDRARYWQLGWEQIVNYKPILPMHNIPDLIVIKNSRREIEISYGAHNTPLQLLRIFGIFMGIALIVCYMKSTILSSRFIRQKNKDVDLTKLLYITAFSNSITLFLTGTAAMLPVHSVLFFSLFGIAFEKLSSENQIIPL